MLRGDEFGDVKAWLDWGAGFEPLANAGGLLLQELSEDVDLVLDADQGFQVLLRNALDPDW